MTIDITTAGPPAGLTDAIAPTLARMIGEADPALIDHLADDVALRASGDAEWAGTHRGRDAVVSYLLEIGEAFPDQQIDVLDVLTSRCRIAFVVRVTIAGDGASVTDTSVWTVMVDADGQIVDWELNDFDQYAMDAFWGRFPRSGP